MKVKTPTQSSLESLEGKLEELPEVKRRKPPQGITVVKVVGPENGRSRAKTKDIRGQKFQRLTVLDRVGTCRLGRAVWKCLCECGVTTLADGPSLRTGNTKSCGCLKREIAAERCRNKTTHGDAIGGKVTREYRTWSGMWTRCTNPNSECWNFYGGRGITICDRWKDFAAFLSDMGRKPVGMTIERVDTNGPYCPENCIWATIQTQANNRRDNVKLTFRGETHGLGQWAKIVGLNPTTLGHRIRSGWPVEMALTEPTGYKPKTRKKNKECDQNNDRNGNVAPRSR